MRGGHFSRPSTVAKNVTFLTALLPNARSGTASSCLSHNNYRRLSFYLLLWISFSSTLMCVAGRSTCSRMQVERGMYCTTASIHATATAA